MSKKVVFLLACLVAAPAFARARVLLSAFETFGGRLENSSQSAVLTIVQQLRERPDPAIPADVDFVLLPVAYEMAPWALLSKMDAYHPDVVISVGEWLDRTIRLEQRAQNRDFAFTPDSQGVVYLGNTIVEGAPEFLPTGLPVEDIQRDLSAAGIASRLSDSAGSYVCNHLFYRLMHVVSTEPAHRGVTAGFVHVPMANIEDDPKYPERYAQAMRLMLRHIFAER